MQSFPDETREKLETTPKDEKKTRNNMSNPYNSGKNNDEMSSSQIKSNRSIFRQNRSKISPQQSKQSNGVVSGGITGDPFDNHSLGRVAMDKEKLLEEQKISLGVSNILELEPENWKNIPAPIINAVKLIIDA